MRTTRRIKPTVRLRCETLEDRLTPATAFALITTTNSLISFDTANAAIVNPPLAITGQAANESFVGIDFRPQNGLLYGLATSPVTSGSAVRLFAISTRTGVATPLTATPSIFVNEFVFSTIPVPITGTGFGFDFNPAVDRIRVVTDTGFNFRINPNTGELVDGDPNTNGVQPDGAQSGSTATASGAAYTNDSPNSIAIFTQPATTLYVIDADSDRLSLQSDPNAGTETFVADITLNGQPLDFTEVNGFDIPAGVNAAANNAPATGLAFASLTTARGTRLYTIDLTTGAATDLGPIAGGTAPYNGLAIQTVQPGTGTSGTPLVGVSTSSGPGGFLSRFNSANPADGQLSQGITGVAGGETLVGFDFRPQTGQLYGLAINATADTGTLYLIDPQTRTATTVGTAGSVAFTTNGTTAVDFPDPATVGYGFDFNPTVDRIRVVTGTGLNFRINPITGAPVDGDNGGAPGSVANINPDADINGATNGLDASAYTNSFAQMLGNVGPTTLYGLNSATDSLYIQSNPNGGVTTLVGAIRLTAGGPAIDFTFANGFDIQAGVRTNASNTAVQSGFGLAALTVAGTTSLYRIDLTSGIATNLGPVGVGSGGPLSGLTAADTPVGTVAFTGATFGGTEGGNATITLTRTEGSVGAFTATVIVTGGTATAGTDFTAGPYTVNFADGQMMATLTIPIATDSLTEGNETVNLTLSASTNGSVRGAQSTATLTITDVPRIPAPTPAPTPTPTPNPAQTAIATGTGIGGGSISLYGANGGVIRTFNPFGNYSGGVTVAIGDVNGDGYADIITGTAIGVTHVKVFDGATGAVICSFFAYEGSAGGVSVGAGDIDGDGFADILTGASVNGHVKAFSGATGAEIRSFFAYGGFTGAVTVAAGDIDGDGRADIITGASINGHVKAFRGTDNAELRSYFAYQGFTGAVSVAAADLDGDGRADIITGSSLNGHVKAFDGATGAEIRSFFAYPGFPGSVSVAGGDADGDGADDIITGAGPGGGPHVKVFRGTGFAEVRSFFAFDNSDLNGVFVG